MTNVLLLREPSSEGVDRYELAFQQAGYRSTSLAVLTTVHDNVERLLEVVRNGPKAQGFMGVVITSKRSCDAWREALVLLRESESESSTIKDILERKSGVEAWCNVPFYVVGQATATALRNVFADFKDLGLTSVDIRGQSSGNAAVLAPFILEDVKTRPAKLLYLTGDKNRDTISRSLEGGGISLEALQVYRTEGSPLFEEHLVKALDSMPKDSQFWWIIYFAPSAATFVTPILRNHFHLEDQEKASGTFDTSALIPTKVAAIGPTTNDFLRDELKVKVDVMAPKPTPDDVVSAVLEYDGRSQ